jgi:hypothetical protein
VSAANASLGDEGKGSGAHTRIWICMKIAWDGMCKDFESVKDPKQPREYLSAS